MRTRKLHGWDVTFRQARELQTRLTPEVRLTPIKKAVRLVAGLDCAFSKDRQWIIGCAVVMRLPKLEVIETAHAVDKAEFPYIPGLLSFRETPVCIAAVEKLKHWPDLFIIDGQGTAHPRRFGLACHLGLFFQTPTIGCAKSRLTGTFEYPASEKGSYSLLEEAGEVIGAVVRTRSNVKPLFVSPGHKCTLDDAVKWTLKCTTRYRLPEPTRIADKLVGKLKTKI
ncbi:MAG: deoxyribonuclease V [Planctomycetota bacterium]|jgi:deoxyribonuclease V